MIMNYKSFTDCVDLVGTACQPFDGNKNYISTGAVDIDHIIEDDVEIIDFSGKPSRANLEVSSGDVIFAKMQGTKKTLSIDDSLSQNIYSTGFCAVRAKEGVLINRCLYHLLTSESFLSQKDKNCSGATQKAITNAGLKKIIIKVPDYSEQEIIVEQLDRVTNIISKRKKELQALDDLVKARFVEMFGDPIVNQKGFTVYRMDEVVEFQGGSQPDKKFFEYEPTEENIRLIQIRDYKTDKYITYIPKSLAKRFCTADDIMIGRYGPPIFQILQGIEGSFNVALMKATPKMGNREFVRWFLKQDCLLKYLESMSTRTAGQDGIQMDKLKAYPFPMPPIELQKQFEAFVLEVGKSKFVVQKALDEAQLLFDSLMQQYFG